MLDKVFPKIHAEGYKFIVIFGLATIVLYLISSFLGLIGLILTIWVYYFSEIQTEYQLKMITI